MPMKKAKKGAKRTKGKSKNEIKPDSKSDKERDLERAKSNAALWEARLEVTENSRVEYREVARRLAQANEELTNQQYNAEKDTTDIITLLKKKDFEKDAKIAELEEQLKDQKLKATQEKQLLVTEYLLKINELEEKIKKKNNEFQMIQEEFKIIKEFRKIKADMEKELINMKENVHIAECEHGESLARMEHKFFSEKIRLEKEAEQRITQLAERAHNEAIVQLDEASRSVFKENVHLKESLGYHLKEVKELSRNNKFLTNENASLNLHKEMSELMIKENVAKLTAQRRKISELKAKVETLEKAMIINASEFEHEKTVVQEQAVVRAQAGSMEQEKLQKLLALREQEMSQVKRLARSIVEQRSELELFFHEALAQVKQEILTSQNQYRQEAIQAFRKRMTEARLGRKDYPHIRTFSKAHHSTNSVYTDLEKAESWSNLQNSKVDISELTWEQKEKVLRLLFAKINGIKNGIKVKPSTLSSKVQRCQNESSTRTTEKETQMTFLTQEDVSNISSHLSRFPDLQPI